MIVDLGEGCVDLTYEVEVEKAAFLLYATTEETVLQGILEARPSQNKRHAATLEPKWLRDGAAFFVLC